MHEISALDMQPAPPFHSPISGGGNRQWCKNESIVVQSRDIIFHLFPRIAWDVAWLLRPFTLPLVLRPVVPLHKWRFWIIASIQVGTAGGDAGGENQC